MRKKTRPSYRRLLPCLLTSCVGLATPAQAQTSLTDVGYTLDAPLAAPAIEPPAGALPPLMTSIVAESALTADERTERSGAIDETTRLSFGQHVNSIKTEMIGVVGYMTAVNLVKIAARKNLSSFHFNDEGLFGKETRELGVDKLVHAHNTYMLSELIAARIRRNTRTTRGTAVTGALLASGLMLYSEMYDGFKGGFGFYDLAFNSMGAGFSVLRNTTPGLEEKLDFRVLVIPNDQIYSPSSEKHYRQLRYMFAVKLSGFDRFKDSPLRFVELHGGYYGKGFTDEEEERGDPLKRKLFAGVGINLSQLFFGQTPRTRAARAVSQAFEYWQPPYTYLHTTVAEP